MGDMGEIFRENKKFIMERRQERADRFIPLLEKLGAEKKSAGVWQVGEYFCYPTKGFAMHYKTYKKCGLWKFINKVLEKGFAPIEPKPSPSVID